MRALRDRATTYQSLADDALRQNHLLAHQMYHQRAQDAAKPADIARGFLLEVLGSE